MTFPIGGSVRRTLLGPAWLLLLLFVGAPRPARADAVEVRPVHIARLLGLPQDSIAANRMSEAFRAELERGLLPLQSRDTTSGAPEDTLVHAFRLVDAAPEDLAWTLELSVRVPPPLVVRHRRSPATGNRGAVSNVRTSRGLIVVVTAQSPPTARRPATVGPRTFTLYFAEARRIVAATTSMPGGGYAYPWEEAGEVLARAALECLVEAAGELPAGQQADLEPTVRLASAEESE